MCFKAQMDGSGTFLRTTYAKQKGLTINTKFCVVAFNSRGEVREQFHYGAAVLDNVTEFKCLGMKFHHDGKCSMRIGSGPELCGGQWASCPS